jgi:predicted dehydrogenase
VNKEIQWGMWGCGAIAHSVASDFRFVKGATLNAVASRTEDHARRFALQNGVAKWYSGLEPLLNDAEVDIVYVSTPNPSHMDDCIACIEAGKAVLCEKPFALNLAQAQRIVDAARRCNVFCMEAMWTRFVPAVMEATRCIKAGAIGPIRMIQGNFAFPASLDRDSRVFDIEKGGGALLDLGVYLICLTQQLMGLPQSIRGTARLGATGVDEQSAYQLLYANGAMADLAASLQVRGTNDVVIFGESGVLRLCEPFYCAHRFILKPHAHAQAGLPPSPVGWKKIVEAVRKTPSAKSLRRRLTSVVEVLKRDHVQTFPVPGNGYQFELMEVSRCVREQCTESAIMPLGDSLDVMRTMDVLRSQWGLVYPQEQSDRQRNSV